MTANFPLLPPPGHFLSLQPSFAQSTDEYPSGVPSTSSHTTHGLAPNVASLAAADFDVDVRTGFLPSTKNVERLPKEWELWEEALEAAAGKGVGDGLRVGGGREKDHLWRRAIESMAILPTIELERSLPLMRRSHLVLSYILHFYVHTSPSASRNSRLAIPKSISVPLLAVCTLLDLPPVVTYSDTVLYNFLPLRSNQIPHYTRNPPTRVLASFTNTKSEEQFYIISAMCEMAGAEALRLMRQSLDELFLADDVAVRRLTAYLRNLAVQIDRIGDITLSMMKHVDPEEFFHLIRPWFRGGDADGPNSAGWDFGSSQYDRLYSGPSAGQSSLIHAIDIFLTVDHSSGPPSAPASSDGSDQETTTHIMTDSTPISTDSIEPPAPHPTEATFVERMLEYMPEQHRSFLLHLSTHPTPLRPLVILHAQTHPALVEAYDSALGALKRFREKHMRVVSLFIIQQARRRPSERIRLLLGQEESGEEARAEEKVDIGELRGTGGSPLFKFLKRCRDNTTKAMIGKSKEPNYELQ